VPLSNAQLVAKRLQVDIGLADLGEQARLLFLDVVRDVLAEDLDLRVVQRVGGGSLDDLRDQVLGTGVLDFRLVEQVVALLVLHRVARGGIEDLFLRLGSPWGSWPGGVEKEESSRRRPRGVRKVWWSPVRKIEAVLRAHRVKKPSRAVRRSRIDPCPSTDVRRSSRDR